MTPIDRLVDVTAPAAREADFVQVPAAGRGNLVKLSKALVTKERPTRVDGVENPLGVFGTTWNRLKRSPVMSIRGGHDCVHNLLLIAHDDVDDNEASVANVENDLDRQG